MSTEPAPISSSPPAAVASGSSIHETLNQFQPIGNRWLRRVLQIIPWLILLVIGILIPIETDQGGSGFVMFATGMFAAALALFAFQSLMRRIPETLRALWERRIIVAAAPVDGTHNTPITLEADPAALEASYGKFVKSVAILLNERRQWIAGVIFGLLGSGWMIVVGLRYGWSGLIAMFSYVERILEFSGDFVIGYIVGLMGWRMLVTGYKVWQLGSQFDLTLQLGHPDNCGGLEPVGNLCLWNALITSIAGGFLGGWLIVGPILRVPSLVQQMRAFTPLFTALLVIAVAIAVISFFLPLWRLHQIMLTKRDQLQSQLGQLGHRIDQLARQLLDRADGLDPAEGEKIVQNLNRMRQTYQDYRDIPVWPFNTRIALRFASSQIVPLLGLTGLGQPILKAIASVLGLLQPQ